MINMIFSQTGIALEGLKFYACLTRKGGRRDGTIMIVNPRVKNGICMAALSVSVGHRTAERLELPVVTWTSPDHLARKCQEIDAEEARTVDPAMMALFDKYQRSEEYRIGYALESRKDNVTKLQRAS